MRFSKTTEYALRIFSLMAENEKKLYRAEEIFEKLRIPMRYLRKLLTLLSKSELMHSIQGKSGGFMLSKKIDKISLYDIVKVTTTKSDESMCFFGFKNCAFDNKCSMHDKWESIQSYIDNILKSTTISDLTNKRTNDFIYNNSLFIKND